MVIIIASTHKAILRPLKKAFPLGQDTEGRAEKVLERIPLIGSCSKVNPFK
jgi:hypothetical protein